MPQFSNAPPAPPSADEPTVDGGFPTIADEGRNRRQFTPKQPITPKDPLDDMDRPRDVGPSDKELLQHIGLLMQHGHDPEISGWFDQKYGAGMADSVTSQ